MYESRNFDMLGYEKHPVHTGKIDALKKLGRMMINVGPQLFSEGLPRISALDLRPDREIVVTKVSHFGHPNHRPIPGQLALDGYGHTLGTESVIVSAAS